MQQVQTLITSTNSLGVLRAVQILPYKAGESKSFENTDDARTFPVFSIGETCDDGVAGGRVDPEKSKIVDNVIFGRSLSVSTKIFSKPQRNCGTSISGFSLPNTSVRRFFLFDRQKGTNDCRFII